MVAAGIFASRVFGLVRSRVVTHYFGTSWVADAFTATLRIPNLLQNLFGEGVLSASFIPVYANLLARGEREEANRVAGAVAAMLALVISVLVLIGVLAAPLIVDVVVGGFEGEKRELTVRLVRILFPGAGILVLSAWCLGILNSHRRFFLSYAAPVLWNVAIIAFLIGFGAEPDLARLAEWASWGAVAGALLQLGVQLPSIVRLTRGIRFRPETGSGPVRDVGRNFLPAVIGRGAAQISAYVDMMIASQLPNGAVAALSYAQNLYMLPISLFGMSVAAAALPGMSGELGTEEERRAGLRARVQAGLAQIAFFVVPSAMAFAALGHVIAAGLYQTGRFVAADSYYVWGILAGSAVGLLASTLGRLYASTYYALRDTRTPLRYGLVRITLTIGLGLAAALWLPGALGIEARWGAAGLTASGGVAGWVEFVLLRRTLNRRIGSTGVAPALLARLWLSAGAAAGTGWGIWLGVRNLGPVPAAVATIGTFGLVYLFATYALGVMQARALLGRLGR